MSASDLMAVVAYLCLSLAAGLLAVILKREIREELSWWRPLTAAERKAGDRG